MYSLVLAKKEDENTYEVVGSDQIIFDDDGFNFINIENNKPLVPIEIIATNEHETVLNEIKLIKNRGFPKVVLVQHVSCTTRQDPETRLSKVRQRLFEEGEQESVVEIKQDCADYSDDSVRDPDYTLSSDDSDMNEKEYNVEEFCTIKRIEYLHKENNTAINKATNGKKSQDSAKKNCCLYCRELYSKITLHLERKHKDKTEVKKFMELPKGSLERKCRIQALRREGNFLYKQENGNLVPVRRTRKSTNYVPCGNCKGFYGKSSLRKHFKICLQTYAKGSRKVLALSRRLQSDLHPKACTVLREEVFPILRDDIVTRTIKYDELVIIYANKMCMKYRSKHHHKMIRARLRLMARFFIEMKSNKPEVVTDFASIFHPNLYDDVIKSINNVAQLDENRGVYKAPATAAAIGTALKYISNLLKAEYIKKTEYEKEKNVDAFANLLRFRNICK